MAKRSPEYWRSRTYDVFYYGWMFFWCVLHLQSPRNLMKANFSLPHGGSALGSKFEVQEVIGADKFPATKLVIGSTNFAVKQKIVADFAEKYGYPVLLKPDKGFVGKGIFKLESLEDMPSADALSVDYLAQAFVEAPLEFGLFYARKKNEVSIPSINQKHFPTITGDGKSTLINLARQDERYSEAWQVFLTEHDPDQVLPEGEVKQLSYLGSNTLGSKFTEDTHLKTPALKQALIKLFADVPGYNFGRLDVRAKTLEEFQAGKFIIIEANGMMSIPTNMIDPDLSFWAAMKIWHHHADLLVKIARERRKHPMVTMPLLQFVRESRGLINEVENQHELVRQH